jgi:hypothetical protein
LSSDAGFSSSNAFAVPIKRMTWPENLAHCPDRAGFFGFLPAIPFLGIAALGLSDAPGRGFSLR